MLVYVQCILQWGLTLQRSGTFMIAVELVELHSNFISAGGKSAASTFEIQVQGP
jgi:hypothetical protein